MASEPRPNTLPRNELATIVWYTTGDNETASLFAVPISVLGITATLCGRYSALLDGTCSNHFWNCKFYSVIFCTGIYVYVYILPGSIRVCIFVETAQDYGWLSTCRRTQLYKVLSLCSALDIPMLIIILRYVDLRRWYVICYCDRTCVSQTFRSILHYNITKRLSHRISDLIKSDPCKWLVMVSVGQQLRILPTSNGSSSGIKSVPAIAESELLGNSPVEHKSSSSAW